MVDKQKINFKKELIIWFILLLVYTFSGFILKPIANFTFRLFLRCLIALLVTGFCFYYMNGFKLYSDQLKLDHIKIYNGIFIAIVIIFYVCFRLLIWLRLFTNQSSGLINSILVALAAGFCEEALFRGMLFNMVADWLKKQKYIWLEISLIISLMFGLMHFVNFFRGEPLLSVMAQIFYAFSAGLMFTYFRLFSNHLWSAILAHVLFDLTIIPKNGVLALENKVIPIAYLVFGILAIIWLFFIWNFNRLFNKINDVNIFYEGDR